MGAFIAVVLVAGGMAYLSFRPGAKSSTSTSTSTAADTAACTWTENTNPQVAQFLKKTGTPAAKGLPASGTRVMTLTTNQGIITITLDVTKAPCAAASITYLAAKKFYDGSQCDQLSTTGVFVLECGDLPGVAGPEYTFASENLPTATTGTYPAGTVAMANEQDPNLNSSQFLIFYKDTPDGALPSNYTVVGTATTGIDVVQKVAAGGLDATDTNGVKPKLDVHISSVEVGPITPNG